MANLHIAWWNAGSLLAGKIAPNWDRNIFQLADIIQPIIGGLGSDLLDEVAGNQRPFIVVGNHWPSRSGGQYKSEPFRIIAGEPVIGPGRTLLPRSAPGLPGILNYDQKARLSLPYHIGCVGRYSGR